MDEMREIVTVEQVQRLFSTLAVAGPVAGLLLGALVGARRGRTASDALCGLLVGMIFVLNLGMWTLYNALTDRFGLDSVKNLLINLALFVGLGVAAGLILGYQARRRGVSGGGMAPVGAPSESAHHPPARLVDAPDAGSAGEARRPEESNEPPRDS
jgi:heme A synthase